jgi:hypothetical protein
VEGVIDIIATDHAPHAVEDKECEWAYARPGMLGLETALPIALEVFGPEWDLIAERMSRTPARIAGLAEHGHDPAPALANLRGRPDRPPHRRAGGTGQPQPQHPVRPHVAARSHRGDLPAR